MVSDEGITKYQAMCAAIGLNLSREEAHEHGIILVQLIKHIKQPMTVGEYEELQQDRRKSGVNEHNN